jgi:tripartite-type tricarboxylate transporter receptor subunit TctC
MPASAVIGTSIAPAQVRFWDDILRGAVVQPSWRQELSRLSWSAMYRDGPALHAYLAAEWPSSSRF